MTKIALAIPLALGIAGCSTMGAHSSRDTTGAMWTDGAMRGDPSSEPSAPSAQQQAEARPQATGPEVILTAQLESGSPSSSGSSEPLASSGSSDSMESGPGGSAETTGSGEGGSSWQAQQDASPGAGEAAAQPEPETVKGKLSKISKDEISVTPKGGLAKILKLSPETLVTINGKDAKPSQLRQGQVVLASYWTQGGDDVAVKIVVDRSRQGQKAATQAKRHGSSMGGADSGASGSMGR